ncbi:aminotransferase-like domain-containing protein [Massilia antarctica]|uniref:aminotransferase-like domain-containing protein n=1 Tax=Massilia antarctica TaxID=2765360 RepID=UPI0006BB63CE|nr:PLP-dependent aminotransferase family protein [Massilia sp. H27-R4]MCY0913052.1 PLP-dependent aminotransferase family protein [Massilia sp. H27-R4]CUI07635.1 Transcriptional regulator, GntR family domain / Aspartate aminotransferase [Janthinobacterium sp. CG23_2]CUU31421.1 Transcriptional regulator, GntR family domain / Aspartate aminotransferase [Janthinobacterium sp. CG23_2]
MDEGDVLHEEVPSGNFGDGWPVLAIERSKRGGLVDQIVAAITQMVSRRELRVGTKMPSVRRFAKCNGVSTFTVVESYDRLLTLGLLSSRRGSGFFVARSEAASAPQQLALQATPAAIDALTPELYSGVSDALPVGAGWLPPEWYGDDTVLDAVRHAMKIPASRLRGYGHPLGFPTLRQHMAATLADELFAASPDQILLTHGATHAFDLILRTLTKPGDTVFVEDPGYSNLLSLIRHHGCIAVGIARGPDGLDMEVLTAQAAALQPKLMFVNTVLQNPLGTSLTQAQAHRLLLAAEQFDFWLVEDDIYRELATGGDASLAAMDGLRRVIRVGSFSKTLSPVLRVGSICASNSLIPELLRVKMLTGLTTSEINERAVYHAISARPYKRMLERLTDQLQSGRERTIERLFEAGMEPLARPRGGMFVSAGWPDAPTPEFNGKVIADRALRAGILLSPHEFFMLRPSPSIWFRFNVAYAADTPQLVQFLQSQR